MSVKSFMTSDGGEFQNITVSNEGTLKTIEPFCNGILVNYVYAKDDNGDPYLKPILSTVCKDKIYSAALTREAHVLLRSVKPIQLAPGS